MVEPILGVIFPLKKIPKEIKPSGIQNIRIQNIRIRNCVGRNLKLITENTKPGFLSPNRKISHVLKLTTCTC